MTILILHRQAKISYTSTTTSAQGLGGIEMDTQHLAAELAKRNHEVCVLNQTEDFVTEKDILWGPYSRRAVAMEKLGEPDVIVSQNDAIAFRDFAKNIPKVVWLHNPLPFRRCLRKGQFLALLQTRPHVVSVGQLLNQSLSPLYPFRSRRVIGLGVSPEFQVEPKEQTRPRSIWVSQGHRGLHETIGLWSEHIAPQAPEAELLVFGSQHREKNYSPEALKNARIRFMPRTSHEELVGYLRDSRLMIYPGASDETFCLAAAEASCCGVPLVTRGIGSLTERITSGVNGQICQSDEEVVAHSLRLLQDEDYWRSLRQKAAVYQKDLTWTQVSCEWESYLNSLVSNT